MHKVWAVIRREFLERVRTRAFIFGTVLFPVLMVGITILPAWLASRETAPKRIAVVDATEGAAGAQVADALGNVRRGGSPGAIGAARYTITRVSASPDRLDAVRDSLIAFTGLQERGADGFDGVLVMDEAAVASGRPTYYGVNVGSQTDMRRLETELQTALRFERLRRVGIDPIVAAPALRPVDLITKKVTDGKLSGESGGASFFLAYIMGFVLYFAMVLYGVQVMTAVIEEKSSRIAEVLASSLSPFQMMLGKVLGVGAVGLLQLGIWGGTAMLVTTYRGQLAKLMGLPAEAIAGAALPAFKPDLLAVFLLFFVLGFLLFSAAYAAVAAMCNSLQETQQANAPITMCIIAGFISVFALLNEPTGDMARILTLVPVLSPFVVPVRYSLTPIPPLELALSAILTFGLMLAVVWVAARIYRVGILMYGKRPGFREVIRWVREA